jgi:hypothetical protein
MHYVFLCQSHLLWLNSDKNKDLLSSSRMFVELHGFYVGFMKVSQLCTVREYLDRIFEAKRPLGGPKRRWKEKNRRFASCWSSTAMFL